MLAGALAAAMGATCAQIACAAPPPGRFAFPVAVTLSSQAAARLAAASERIIASAAFYGDPVPSAVGHADAVGRIDLGVEQAFVDHGVARITGSTVRRGRLAWLRRRAVEVNVNLYTARLSGPDNLLDCDFFEGAIETARLGRVRLACKLIGEARAPT